jgi:hypothetical protein
MVDYAVYDYIGKLYTSFELFPLEVQSRPSHVTTEGNEPAVFGQSALLALE